MPQKSQTVVTNVQEARTIQALAYGALLQLGWNIKFAGEKRLLAYTPRKWNKWNDEITIETRDGQFTITSKMIHNEQWDMMGRNKKHIEEFLRAFESVKSGATDLNKEEWQNKIAVLKEETLEEAEKEVVRATEADRVMNFSTGNMYATYGIMAINTIIFILMVANGVDFMTPTSLSVLKWGGNLGSLTFGGDWWRLISSVFLHFGILHLALNMYALYFVGSYLEPMLGKTRYLAAYLCTGIIASLISILWHKNEIIVSAGASGAIFGMFGVFLSLLTTNIVPKHVKTSLMQSVLIFVAYNVFYGFKPNSGVDNAAHLGGLGSGMIIGYIYYFSFKQPTTSKKYIITALTVIATLLIVFAVLQKEKLPPTEVDYTTGQFFKKGEKSFEEKWNEFAKLEDKALEVQRDTSTSSEKLLNGLETISLPVWKEAKALSVTMEKDAANDHLKEKVSLLQQYIDRRTELVELLIKSLRENNTENNKDIDRLGDEISTLIDKLKTLEEDKAGSQ